MSDSYYGHPVVKPHVWTPMIPAYFWIGGVAGVSAVHAAVARLRGNERLADKQRLVAIAGMTIAPVLLIADLGVPARFINMLRVVKPTSPMNLGTWLLTAFGGTLGLSLAADLAGLRPLARGAEVAAGLLGPVVTTYTAVLIADTATPVWHEAYRDLPFVFAANGIASAGAVGVLLENETSSRAMLAVGSLATVLCTTRMEKRLGPLLGRSYRRGQAKTLHRVTRVAGIGGALLSFVVPRAGAALTIVAGIAERFMILAAGKDSAQDPEQTVIPQRERLDARRAA